MIRWRDTDSGIRPQPLAALQARLSFVDALLLEADATPFPWVLLAEPLHRQVRDQLSRSRNEQGGLLIGEAYARESGPIAVVRVSAAIASEDSSSTAISLRMESGVWSKARDHLGAQRLVVGWFHSHPGIGAFFSATDHRTQRAFFHHPYSIGWVIDPDAPPAAERFFLGAEAEEVPAARVRILRDDPLAGGSAGGRT